MAARGLSYWAQHGKPWQPARPVGQLATILRAYGYRVFTLGDDRHLRHSPAEDHTPFAETGWPVPSPYGWVFAADIMPPAKGSGLPSLAALGRQLVTDRNGNHPGARWIKYLNWEPGDGRCLHESWTPGHAVRSSTDRGHIHVSGRTDCRDYQLPADYDPIAAIRGARPAAPTPTTTTTRPPAVRDWTETLIMGLPTLRRGSTGLPVRRLQALVNVVTGSTSADGVYGPDTERGVRAVQRRGGLAQDGIAGPRVWSYLLGQP